MPKDTYNFYAYRRSGKIQDTSCSLFRFVGINNGIFVVIIDLIQRYENKVVLH